SCATRVVPTRPRAAQTEAALGRRRWVIPKGALALGHELQASRHGQHFDVTQPERHEITLVDVAPDELVAWHVHCKLVTVRQTDGDLRVAPHADDAFDAP